MTILFTEPSFVPVSGNSVVYPGAKLYFYETGTSNLQNTYSEYTLTTAHANPVVADADGRFAPIYLDPSLEDYKVVLKDSSDVTIWTVDPYSAGSITANGSTVSDLLAADGTLNPNVRINGYHTAGDGGGGEFYWDASQDKANHNGFTIIDPDITFPASWSTASQVSAWFTAGTGTGCWMRVYDRLSIKMAGSRGLNDMNALKSALGAIDANTTLYIDDDLSLEAGLSITLTNDINVDITGTITYSGASQVGALIDITAAGNSVSIQGKNSLIDCNNLCNVALLISNDTDTAADCTLKGVNTLDNKLNDNTTLPSVPVRVTSGISIWGKWENCEVEDCHVTNVSRVGGLTSPACQAFIIARRNSRWAKHITVRKCTVDTVSMADAAGTSAYIDCDGFALFQSDDDEGSMYIENVAGTNCTGRVIKLQPANTPVVNGVQIYRNVRGNFPISAEIAVQYGAGFISNIHAIYEGTTTFSDRVYLIESAPGAEETEGFGSTHVDNVTIFNRATGNLDGIVIADYNLTDTHERMLSISDIKVVTGSVDYLISSSTLGVYADTSMTIDGFVGSIGSALVRADGAPDQLDGHVSRVINTGSEVPVIVDKDGTSMGNVWGRWHDGGSNKNIAIYTGETSATPGLSANIGRMARVYPGDTHSVAQGWHNFGTKSFDNAEQVTYTYGFTQGTGLVLIHAGWAGRTGIYTTLNGSTTIDTIAAGTSVSVGTGSEPAGSVDIKIWVAGNVLYVKNNTGSAKYITVSVFC